MRGHPISVMHAGYTVLCAGPDGWLDGDPSGLFDYDTRILSRYVLMIDGARPQLVASEQPESDEFVAFYRLPFGRDRASPEGPALPEDALELALERLVGPGMHDRWTVRNHSALDWAGRIWFEVAADFADMAEVGRNRQQQGETAANVRRDELELRYNAVHEARRFERGIRIRITAEAPVEVTERGLGVRFFLPTRGHAAFAVEVSSQVDGRWRGPAPGRGDAGQLRARRRSTWRRQRVQVDADARLRVPFERAVEDLFALRNDDLARDLLDGTDGPPGREGTRRWVLNAGVPSFTGYFGRDTLTSGWQAALAGMAALRGALEVAAATQATSDDPWRDAEPGKMLHELRRGPLAMLGLSPRDAYYGSQTTPAIFVLALSELWHWTGDDEVLRRYRDAAMRATEWAERVREVAGGFVTYERRSPRGLRNQGWKDSDEAIRHADGRIAETPLATVEEQAFHFLALQRTAEILVALDEPEQADECLRRATALRHDWHDAFWMPDEAFYAVALDRDGRQVRSITSNPGHALASGIVPPEHARQVADRLLSPALFNGWGVRTLADDHPSYNPLAYHLGTVWPVENATFALGFKRYGLDDHFERLAGAMLDAAAASPAGRLPEAMTGHPRRPHVGPAPYPGACAPQAWSSSAVVQLMQMLLGLYPFAPLQVLTLIRPRLPSWLPEVTLRNVRVGKATVDLRFERREDGSASHEVTRRVGTLHVIPAGPPMDVGDEPPWLERLGQAALERAPGRLARAARIAVGLD